MTWHMIRLDLARSPEWPEGSSAISYLLRVPLGGDDMIDAAALAEQPQRATVLRSRPDERDVSGYVLRKERGWVLSYAPGEGDDETLVHPEVHPFRTGGYVSLLSEDEEPLLFRVASVQQLPDSEPASPADVAS